MSENYIGGFHAVMAALEDGAVKPFEILLSDSRQDERARRLLAAANAAAVPVRQVSKSDIDMRAPELRHQGVLALIPERELLGEDALEAPASPERIFLALDGVQDPHNLGACLRTAEAVGATAVIIPKDRAAGLSPVVLKAAAGAAERVPLIAVTNLTRTLEQLKERGYWVTGLAGEATESLFDVDLTGPLVLVMGAEGAGMRRLTRETCDRLVKIPMLGKTESLNVSVAAAVCLYEAFRQRQPGGKRR
ncbi:23S rRNA (guanosine(2251)-2'-O)-methyltransferase RlmB [Hydrocarboniphaga sp.]|uniref:23S rRNA (guanosine(2251)-2'-O)-methyltransferase RlmB n=1 Tax=Hydrocarboniphaga sp. TaxID=2033016 RepID=UPI003D09F9F4